MRTLAIGDIHGCSRALDLVIEMVKPRPDDIVVTLGDYVDRGPDSRGVLDRLIELQRRCQLVALRGNHDIMMLNARTDLNVFESWIVCGGDKAMHSYGFEPIWDVLGDGIPPSHWRFLEGCQAFYKTDTHFFVHANAYPDIPLAEQPDHMLFWESLHPDLMRLHESGKIMVCGHSSQRSGKPLNLGYAVCIDTWAYGHGWLTCLDVRTGQYWQASENGNRQTRMDWLEEPG